MNNRSLWIRLLLMVALVVGVLTPGFADPTSEYLRDLYGGSRFTLDPLGVITDHKTGLQWLEGPAVVSWRQAKSWIDRLDGWRRPKWEELKSLYQKESVGPFGNHLDPVFRQETHNVWADRGHIMASGVLPQFGVFWYDFDQKQHCFAGFDKNRDVVMDKIRVFAVRPSQETVMFDGLLRDR